MESFDVKCEPDVGNGIIPETRDCAKRGQEKVVEDADKETGKDGG